MKKSLTNIHLNQLDTTFGLVDGSFGIKRIHPSSRNNLPKHDALPHSHDSYFIKYIHKGKGFHTTDFTKQKVSNENVFFLNPGQVHSFNINDVNGFVIYFKKDFIFPNALPFFLQSFTCSKLKIRKFKQELLQAFHQLFHEFEKDDLFKEQALITQLNYILILLTREFHNQNNNSQSNISKPIELLRKLDDLIESNYKIHKPVSFYSDALGISNRQLNNILRNNLELSISDILKGRLLREAKRLLIFTDKNITEIAYLLGFSDKSYFHQYFKKNIAFTPQDFRKKNK